MTPILTKAIQEINANITDISNLTRENTWRDAITAWLGDITNGINRIFAHEVKTERICVTDEAGETCLTRGELDQLLGGTSAAPEEDGGTEPEVPEVPQVPAGNIDDTSEEQAPEVPVKESAPEIPTEQSTEESSVPESQQEETLPEPPVENPTE
ncbi:hypothetical protein IT401_01745 [Candidatus Nomurabacteria bacterium]|nr:hypothetical protein [Candidatus Nomurabacteria bacterium]